MELAERIARRFHEAYEQLAPQHGYETRNESRCPWSDVPENNRDLMVAVTDQLMRDGVIEPGAAIRVSTFPGRPARAFAGQTEIEDAGEPR